MRLLLLALLLPLLAVPVRAQDAPGLPQVAVQLDPAEGEVGLNMRITLSVAGDAAADCTLLPLPPVDGARLTLLAGPSMSQNMVVVNGRVTRSLRTEWMLELVPESPGRLEVGPFRINCRGEEVASRVISLNVRASAFPSDTVTLEVGAADTELWQGQVFALDVTATLDERSADKLVQDGLELDLPWLAEAPGLLRLEAPEPQGDVTRVRVKGYSDGLRMRFTRDARDGRARLVLTRTFLMLAVEPGEVRLPLSRFSARLATEVRQERDPFSLLGGRTTQVVRSASVDARAAGPVLVVREPPADGRPPGYTNAVGRFKLAGTATPTTLRVGDTCSLTLTLTGDGNIDFFRWPEFDELKQDFRIFGKVPRKLPRTQVLEIQVSPKSIGVTEVPALTISAFDPAAGRYETHTVGPFTLTVTPGGSDGLTTLESPSETLSSLETVRETLPEPSSGPPSFWLLALPGALLLAVVELAAARRAWRARNPALVARRGARRRLDEALAGARAPRDLAAAFSRFLAERLGGPPSGLSAEEAAARLSDADLARDLRTTVARWEAATFGGAGLDLAAARDEAARLADRVEAAP